MLSDHEQRAIEELERCFATEAQEPVRSGPLTRRPVRRATCPPGLRVVLACVAAAVLFAAVPEAALALALAAAIGWSSWRLWPYLADGGSVPPGGPFRPRSERPAEVEVEE
ncbi:hypothetical protein [Modestobacter sp. I12A-02662]|uniref:hypothetical protein n=1 Tax=Modestobacter sp. I12A-02662 TaxID=1730496 RepID=UPI0034E04CFC